MYRRMLLAAAAMLAGAVGFAAGTTGGPVNPCSVGRDCGSGYIVQHGGGTGAPAV
ncbi:hypothetical protein [Dactylosporangium sp. NPDC051541]|uniref:hypothetical protein n=1 Tax=Dactylosporangium sp. NPDC051541 TaxID=3363977 RepID=UPI00379B8F3E